MSRTRRNFTAKFKADLVIELLKGEKELNILASENNIQPNLLRNWKKEFLAKAASAFDDSRDENIRQKLAHERKEKEEYAKKVGQLTMQVDWLKNNLKKFLDLNTRVNLVKNLLISDELPVSTGARLMGINRSSVYYVKSGVSQDELDCKAEIDKIHTDNPAWESRQITKQLKRKNFKIGMRRVRRYMQEMCVNAIFPGPNLSKRLQYAKVVPYLLRNAVIIRPNQAWSVDITYIALKHGFIYLTAIIDWYSRCIVAWEIDDTLDTDMVLRACRKAFRVATPEILNSDQGSQFTSNEYKQLLKSNGIRQSMDGKSRWADNIMIERWFRTIKYEEIYLTQYANIKEARKAIRQYINTYNFERIHSSIGDRVPAEAYYPALLIEAARKVA